MLTSVDLGRMAANLRLADNTHQRVDECIALKSTIETPAVGSLDTSRLHEIDPHLFEPFSIEYIGHAKTSEGMLL